MATTVRLKLPPKWDSEPAWINREYPTRTFDFDTEDRAASSEKHRALFEAVGAVKLRFRCTCRDDRELAVMVRLRKPPYLALMPDTSLLHRSSCAFHRASITSHVLDAITEEEGKLRVRLNFRLGMPAPGKERPQTLNEAPLRTRQAPTRQLNKFGLNGLLRLLFSEAGLHRWPRRDRTAEAGARKPIYARLLQTLGWIDAQGQRAGTLKKHTRIGEPGVYDPGTVIAVVDVIERVEPTQKYYWKCYLAGWGKHGLLIHPDEVRALLAQLRFHQTRAKTTLAEKRPILPRETEVWWGCLLVRVEEGTGKWYRVIDHAALRTDRHGIPAESLDEIEMTQHLIELERSCQWKENVAEGKVPNGPLAVDYLDQLTCASVLAFIEGRPGRKSEKLAEASKRHYKECFVQLVNYALRHGDMVASNVAFPNPMTSLPEWGNASREIIFLTETPIDEQLGVLKPFPSLHAAVATMIHAGPRRAEALWLNSSSMKETKGERYLSIRKVSDGAELQSMKTKGSARSVTLEPVLAVILDAYLPGLNSKWLFPSPRGLRWDKDHFSQQLAAVNKEHGLPWSAMHYRHTYATQRAAAGVRYLPSRMRWVRAWP